MVAGQNNMDIEIRPEHGDDVPVVRRVNALAFGQPLEADLVDALRANGGALLSLVAVVGDRIVGHILYSTVEIGAAAGAGLAPMAVLPEFQRRGIGSLLVRAGNRQMDAAGCPFIVVLGHPRFYPRFGFTPARPHGITCAWPVPDDVFLVRGRHASPLVGVTGLARYRPEFSAVTE